MPEITRIGFMGFGRIGRNVFRMIEDEPQLEAAAIADVAEPQALAYLLKFDTIYGRYPREVDYREGTLHVGDARVPILQEKQPGDVPWRKFDADIVIDATGKYRTSDWCRRHLDAGARRVIVASTPESHDGLPILLSGVNDDVLTPETPCIALGSNTSNAIAPVLQVLVEAYGIEQAFFTTVHAITNKVRLADVPGEDLRTGRAARENIIPTSTNSPQILERVLPGLKGKLSATALNVPVPDGSAIDLVAFTQKPMTKGDFNQTIQRAAVERYANILEYVDDPIVSSDVRGSRYSGVFDSLATMASGRELVKCLVWFDTGWGYSARIVDTIKRMAGSAAGKGVRS